MLADDQPLRKLADRAIRRSLADHWENLQALLRRAVPHLADRFDCAHARLLDREFPLDDWRHREADLPFEVPFRLPDAVGSALVCVLLEHQSDTDTLVPLRLLCFAVVYWDRQWAAWEKLKPPRPPLRLNPVLPLVLYTGPTPWGSNTELVQLLGGPEELHVHAPQWSPVFWNLAGVSVDELLGAEEAWWQALAVIRSEKAPPQEFARVFAQAAQKLRPLQERDTVNYYDLVRILLTWAYWRRPTPERSTLEQLVETNDTNPQRVQEVRRMSSELGQTYWEVAAEQGFALGETKGETKGMREAVLRLGRKRFGEPDKATLQALQAITDPDRLGQLCDRLLDVGSWQELLQSA